MDRTQKEQAIKDIAGRLAQAQAVVVVNYRGISVAQAAELRGKLGEAGASFKVVKNRLAKRAVAEVGTDGLEELLEGPTALTFIEGDVVTATKTLDSFSREHEVLEFKGGTMEGVPLDADRFRALAKLPSLDVMHGQLVGMVAGPLTGLVRGLGSMVSGLAVALGQIQEQGLVGGESAGEPEETETETTPGEAEVETEGSEEAEKEDDE